LDKFELGLTLCIYSTYFISEVYNFLFTKVEGYSAFYMCT
jgi:hypothetical protein